MALAAFDTLESVDTLEKAGIPEPQARAISVVVRKSHESSDVATKADLQHLEERVDAKLDKLSTELRHEIGDLRKDMDAKFAGVDAKLAGVDAKLAGVDAKLAGVDAKLAAMEERSDVKHESLRKDMDAKFAGLEERLNSRLDKLTLQLAFRVGAVTVATLTALSLLPKIFH